MSKKVIKAGVGWALATTVLLQFLLVVYWFAKPIRIGESRCNNVGFKLNINEVSKEMLTILPRVGPAIAENIVLYREANGRFEQAEDLENVHRIGLKTRRLIEPYITFDGAEDIQ
ncbi:ComE operon protein 1 [Poriferisphaera corsica]|uniref:ComE operon protein 1 n=1 Tax=Poriferisphaera corsica TaxID=2528020 RepID=A0A517YTT4_9BACT|nr:helix-hairpin-helix domain-containing protein [Poriferisphaera corsica]QDU33628.1 ComE operon protein 1 [Poriferisphaera corsica]